jgi:hypothetical protein
MKRMGLVSVLVALGVLLVASCEWPHYRGGAASTGVSRDEILISAANVGSLRRVATRTRTGPGISTTVVVAGGRVYDSGGVWDEAMVQGCTGTPKTCAPLWTFSTDGGTALGPVTVADGLVYRATRKQTPSPGSGFLAGRVEAFDAAGVTNCGGSPKICQPVWTGQVPTTFGGLGATFSPTYAAPTVAGGRVYVTDVGVAMGLYAFDADGQDGCTPDIGGTPRCVPLFGSIPIASGTTPSVVDGKVFVASEGIPSSSGPPDAGPGELLAFDAAGIEGCSGSPVVCEPTWRLTIGERPTTMPDGVYVNTVPVVNGVVHAVSKGKLVAAGVDCATGGGTCEPYWQIDTQDRDNASEFAMAVDGGTAVAPWGYAVGVYEPQSCGWSAEACPPVARLGSGTLHSTGVTIANRLAFVTSSTGVAAYDLSLGPSCVDQGGRPLVCSALWQDASGTTGVPVIVNGRLYAGDGVWAF